MATEIHAIFPSANVELIPGGKGDFIVTADGISLWNKSEVGRFPEAREITGQLRAE